MNAKVTLSSQDPKRSFKIRWHHYVSIISQTPLTLFCTEHGIRCSKLFDIHGDVVFWTDNKISGAQVKESARTGQKTRVEIEPAKTRRELFYRHRQIGSVNRSLRRSTIPQTRSRNILSSSISLLEAQVLWILSTVDAWRRESRRAYPQVSIPLLEICWYRFKTHTLSKYFVGISSTDAPVARCF